MPIILLTGALTGVAALALTRWMRTVAAADSLWLRSYAHVGFACLGGAGAGALSSTWVEVPAFAALALACSLLVVIDLSAYRLPDAIVLPMYPIMAAFLLVAAIVTGEWEALGRAAAAGAVLLVVYFALAFAYPAGLGLGDVKLAGLLGLFLGWLGWQQALLGTLSGFVVGGLIGLILLVSRRAAPGTEFPFGPAMVMGAVIGATGWPSLLF